MCSKLFAFALVVCALLGVAISGNADDKFAACCESEGVDVDCCKYRTRSVRRSDSVADSSVGCLSSEGFPKFAKCMAGGLDNTGCCQKNNVTATLCLELCDGTKAISHNNPTDYAKCSGVGRKIFKCNYDANDN